MIKRNVKGQTLIETALVLLLLLVILLGIAEFSRAWFTKNSLKNAVRQGARVVAVTPTAFTTSFSCTSGPGGTACPNTDGIIDAVCCQPGVKSNDSSAPPVMVTVTCSGSTTDCGSIIAGDTVTVQAKKRFFFVIGGHKFTWFGVLRIWPWSAFTDIVTDASMRYE
jgi:Flp pilus assembly protein TadG